MLFYPLEVPMRALRLLPMLMLLGAFLGCQPSAPKKETPPSAKPSVDTAEAAKEDGQSASKPEESAPPAEEPLAEQLSASDFAVHEWGLMRYAAGQLWVSTSPPQREVPEPVEEKSLKDFDVGLEQLDLQGSHDFPIPVGKPLIMLHPGPTFEPSTDITIGVELVSGALREVWPTPAPGAQPLHGASYSWSEVHALAEPCGRELAPARDHAACTSIADHGLCEAAEMGIYLSPVASCLTVKGLRTPALVYNGMFVDGSAPLAFGGGDPETIKNLTAEPLGPLYLHGGEDTLFRIEKLDAGEVLAISDAAPFEGKLKEVLKKDLLAKGLTEGEADSFVAAWSPDVLRQPWVWQVFGFYSPEGVEAIAPLSVSPQPRGIVRVMALTVE